MSRFSDDIIFGFLEEQEQDSSSSESSISSSDSSEFEIIEDDENSANPCDFEESKRFWEDQNQILQATLYRTSSLEMRIRQATKEALVEIKRSGLHCQCRTPAAGDCRSFLQREVSLKLQAGGYNCSICKSKWKSSPEIQAGEHTYLEVVEKSNSKKGEIRVIIELNFRGEFEMARANKEYNNLINNLPEIYVGKSERLKDLIKILCSSAKKCMKEKKMHLGPWRKHKYMQSKWLGAYERISPPQQPPSTAPLPVVSFSDRRSPVKPRASMLTYDMLDTLPVLHRMAVR
ncbi:uncharacterized protein [Euphorbia lathyris]|uniref:uncharacterized protein n=1 Tax=Euphorbia lathyris TaxID=212925 RepID=UPI0033131DF6